MWLKGDGTQGPADLPTVGGSVGVALGSSELWVGAGTHLERRKPDGTVVDTFPLPSGSQGGPLLATSAETQGTTWLCGSFGLYRKDGAAWTRQQANCTTLSPLPGGAWLAVAGADRQKLSGAVATPFARPDPLDATGLITRVDAFDGRVYLTTTLGLRMVSLEQWARVEQGLTP